MKIVPLKLKKVLIENENENEHIIFSHKHFLIIKDKKHLPNSYHFTAWCIKDIRSLLEIDLDIIEDILNIKKYLIKNNIIKKDGKVFIHFPPQFWRLHIHFVDSNHIFEAKKYEIFYIEEIIENIRKNKNYYLENVIIKSKL